MLAATSSGYKTFEQAFLALLHKHAPYKSKKISVNQVPYMIKILRKAIMKRSQLKTKYFKTNTPESLQSDKNQNIFCSKLYKNERNKCYTNYKAFFI